MTQSTITLPAYGTAIAGQGGYFVAIMRGPTVDGAQQQPVALLACDAAHEKETEWGVYGKKLDGCDSRTDGHANTLAMLAADCPAAVHARSLSVDGHSDYFVPSLGELNTAAANAPELFDAEGVYWTSTQNSSYGAFVQDFEYGSSNWDSKFYEFRVRPFRAIPLHTLSTSTL
jgi:hypothetical protein